MMKMQNCVHFGLHMWCYKLCVAEISLEIVKYIRARWPNHDLVLLGILYHKQVSRLVLVEVAIEPAV